MESLFEWAQAVQKPRGFFAAGQRMTDKTNRNVCQLQLVWMVDTPRTIRKILEKETCSQIVLRKTQPSQSLAACGNVRMHSIPSVDETPSTLRSSAANNVSSLCSRATKDGANTN